MSTNKPHPLIGRRVTHNDGHKGRVLAAQHVAAQQSESYRDSAYWSLLVELEEGEIMWGDALRFTFDRPSIKPKASPPPIRDTGMDK